MKSLGIDIGTTTISAALLEDGTLIESKTQKNDSALQGRFFWEKLQNPDRIAEIAVGAVQDFLKKYPDIERIGVTGQMHGILYLDASGSPVSPLYTWQDGSGDQPMPDGETAVHPSADGAALHSAASEGTDAPDQSLHPAVSYAECLSRLTGYEVHTGYGMATYFYHQRNGLVPENACVLCTIPDYVAMVLAGARKPVMDASNAGSIGLFDVANGRFDLTAVQRAGLTETMLPRMAQTEAIGTFGEQVRVYPAIGDNQASFLGTVTKAEGQMLVNVGTGSQFSAFSKTCLSCPGLETRPFPGGGYLIVGASLCGGYAYALLERFFRQTEQMLLPENKTGSFALTDNTADVKRPEDADTSVSADFVYEKMSVLLSSCQKLDNLPQVDPLFLGTRQNPALRGSISGLSVDNFTPGHLIWGFLDGIAGELHQMYEQYRKAGGTEAALVGSGNGLRKNKFLQQCFEEKFGQKLELPDCVEEAASGVAKYICGLK